jgi:peptidoglycan/LPS O-acetylase OafA/YrhL
MVGLLGLGRRWLDRDDAVVGYGRRCGYAFYIVHQPIIIAIAYFVVQTHLTLGAKFAMILIASTATTLLSVELLAHLAVTRAVLGLAGNPQHASMHPT